MALLAYGVGDNAVLATITGNRCFDDQQNKTQTWQLFSFRLYAGRTRDFAPGATEHVVIRQNDLHGNIHPEGLPDRSWARDRMVSAHLPWQANW